MALSSSTHVQVSSWPGVRIPVATSLRARWPLRPARRQQPDRELRVGAAFCCSLADASRLQQRLRAHPDLDDDQVMLLTPADASGRRFASWRQRWDRLRPQPPASLLRAAAPVHSVLSGMLAGLLVGLAMGLMDGAALAAMLAISGLAALGGGVIALALQAGVLRVSPQRRFDRLLQRHLARGMHAVVVRGVHCRHTAADALNALRKGGVGWCAEAPIRPL